MGVPAFQIDKNINIDKIFKTMKAKVLTSAVSGEDDSPKMAPRMLLPWAGIKTETSHSSRIRMPTIPTHPPLDCRHEKKKQPCWFNYHTSSFVMIPQRLSDVLKGSMERDMKWGQGQLFLCSPYCPVQTVPAGLA